MRADYHNVRHVDGRLALEDATLHTAPGVGLVVTLYHVHTFDKKLALAGLNFNDAALLPLVLTRYHDDPVILSNVDL
jgi:hypothetical protein